MSQGSGLKSQYCGSKSCFSKLECADAACKLFSSGLVFIVVSLNASGSFANDTFFFLKSCKT